jgi:hypothetical protein
MGAVASVSANEQWWAILLEDGRVEQVCMVDGAHPRDAGHPEGEAHPIAGRGCHLHQRFDRDAKCWIDNPEGKEKAEYAAKLNAMTRVELVEFIISKLGGSHE